jgi:protein phosphatase
MKISITAASMTGCVRKNNEDMILVDKKFIRNDIHCTMVDIDRMDRYIVAVADGMGGHSCGEVASQVVLQNLSFFFNDLPTNLKPGDFNEAICEWLNSINNIIASKGREESRFRGMGTTLVALLNYNHQFYWMNCGDSRLYRLHDQQLKQLTTDHSLNNLVGIDEHSSILTNCIGGGCKTSYIDMMLCTADVQPGDVFLLCSDGLTDMVKPDRLQQLMNEGADATRLCNAAIDAGGYDNVSVALVKIL